MNRFRNSFCLLLSLTACAFVSAPALAQKDDEYVRPALIKGLYDCQSIANNQERLACFEEAVRAIQNAEERRELSFADREQVREAKRGLFGLGNIRLGIFSRSDSGGDEDQLNEIEANVASITKGRDGKLLIRLEDGVLWAQTDTEKVRIRELGAKIVRIRRGTLGNYVAQLDGGSTIRVRRIN